jgi:hypothetical protein
MQYPSLGWSQELVIAAVRSEAGGGDDPGGVHAEPEDPPTTSRLTTTLLQMRTRSKTIRQKTRSKTIRRTRTRSTTVPPEARARGAADATPFALRGQAGDARAAT